MTFVPGGGGGGTLMYGLDRYVPPERVWFLRISRSLNFFARVGIVFLV